MSGDVAGLTPGLDAILSERRQLINLAMLAEAVSMAFLVVPARRRLERKVIQAERREDPASASRGSRLRGARI